jgi:predicted acylesterase/phospholipase RssA
MPFLRENLKRPDEMICYMTGGGVFGLSQLERLLFLEETTSIPVSKLFSAFVLDSVSVFHGSCLATGLFSAQEYAPYFQQGVPALLSHKAVISGLQHYDSQKFIDSLKKVLGDVRLSDTRVPVIVSTARILEQDLDPFYLTNLDIDHPMYSSPTWKNVSWVDAIMAAISIPGAFDPHEIKGLGRFQDPTSVRLFCDPVKRLIEHFDEERDTHFVQLGNIRFFRGGQSHPRNPFTAAASGHFQRSFSSQTGNYSLYNIAERLGGNDHIHIYETCIDLDRPRPYHPSQSNLDINPEQRQRVIDITRAEIAERRDTHYMPLVEKLVEAMHARQKTDPSSAFSLSVGASLVRQEQREVPSAEQIHQGLVHDGFFQFAGLKLSEALSSAAQAIGDSKTLRGLMATGQQTFASALSGLKRDR